MDWDALPAVGSRSPPASCPTARPRPLRRCHLRRGRTGKTTPPAGDPPSASLFPLPSPCTASAFRLRRTRCSSHSSCSAARSLARGEIISPPLLLGLGSRRLLPSPHALFASGVG
nr:unnamed protein product [Digitaria exilis]